MSAAEPSTAVLQLLASRAPGAAVASLFSEGSDVVGVVRRAEIARSRALAAFAGRVASRVREALLMQVPCEDVIFPVVAPYVARRRTQM